MQPMICISIEDHRTFSIDVAIRISILFLLTFICTFIYTYLKGIVLQLVKQISGKGWNAIPIQGSRPTNISWPHFRSLCYVDNSKVSRHVLLSVVTTGIVMSGLHIQERFAIFYQFHFYRVPHRHIHGQ